MPESDRDDTPQSDAAGTAGGPDVSPLDRDEFLATNRSNREKFRAQAAVKAAKKSGSGGSAGDVTADEAGAESTEVIETAKNPSGKNPSAKNPSAKNPSGTTDSGRVPGKVTTSPGRSPFRSPLVLALIAVTVALAVATGVLGYRYAESGGGAGPAVASELGESAISDAKRFAREIVTYQADDYDELDRRIREISTEEFADFFIASSADARRGTTEAGSNSSATAEDAGLMALGDDSAEVLVALDQELTVPNVSEPVPYPSRVRISLVRDDDRWLLSGFDVV